MTPDIDLRRHEGDQIGIYHLALAQAEAAGWSQAEREQLAADIVASGDYSGTLLVIRARFNVTHEPTPMSPTATG